MNNFKYNLNYLLIKILSFDYLVIRKIVRKYMSGLNYKKVLDLGCGIGSLSNEFPSKSYLGIDIDKGSIDYARKVNPNYKYKLGDVTNFNLNNKFDLIVIIGVFHHLSLKDSKKTLKLVRNHLSRKGKVIIIEAIQPIYSLNIISKFLRNLDRGHYIREIREYERIISEEFNLVRSEEKGGVTFDYASFLASCKFN